MRKTDLVFPLSNGLDNNSHSSQVKSGKKSIPPNFFHFLFDISRYVSMITMSNPGVFPDLKENPDFIRVSFLN